jgi:hypothetical protein
MPNFYYLVYYYEDEIFSIILAGKKRMGKYICYCFNHTEEDIKNEVLSEGRSLILEQIIEAKKAGKCRCEEFHPEKR